jgi:hypothetical protein
VPERWKFALSDYKRLAKCMGLFAMQSFLHRENIAKMKVILMVGVENPPLSNYILYCNYMIYKNVYLKKL